MRQGENWVYDFFMIFVRIWWSIIKAVAFVGVYLVRERQHNLPGPKVGTLTYLQTAKSKSQPKVTQPGQYDWLRAPLVFLLSSCVFGAGILLFAPFKPYVRTGDQLLISTLLVGSGLAGMGWGLIRIHRTSIDVGPSELPEDALTPVEDSNADTEQAIQAIADDETIIVYTVRLPHRSEWDAETSLSFASQLAQSCPELLFSITATHQEITWQILDSGYSIAPELIEQFIRTSYPEAEIDVQWRPQAEVTNPFFRYVCYYRLVNMFVAPLSYVDDFKTFDPLNALTQAMSGLQAGEQITYLLALAGSAQDAKKHGERLVTQSTIHPLQFLARGGIGDAAGKIITGNDRVDKYVASDQRVLVGKLRQRLYYAYLMVQVDAPSAYRVAEIMALLDGQMEHFTHMPFNALSWVERPLDQFMQTIATSEQERSSHVFTLYRRIMSGEFRKNNFAPPFLILEPREMAALWHLPYQDFSAPRITWASGLIDLPEAVARLDDGMMIGLGKYQGQSVNVRLPQADRVTHLNVIGRTGTGKSTLLHTLIHQDIAHGAGVAVIDPHGALVRDILRASIPAEREGDVVVLDIANEAYPPPFNPLSNVIGYSSTLKIVGVIERLFAGTEGAARTASYLRAALVPLQTEVHATMRDVARMFMDDVYREQRLGSVDDPETIDFWDYQYNTGSLALQRQIADPILNRIRPFYANPYLYPLLCHPDTLEVQRLMQQQKIILISLALDEERVPEQERNLIGALLMSQLQMSGMKAQATQPFYIYVDEVQRFVTTSLSEMLSEARKYGLSLTTANQYLGQLTGKTLEAVMGNVGTTAIFRCSPEDASDLAKYTKPQFDAQALIELDRFQAILKMQVQGQTQPAFNVLTLPPIDVPEDASEREQRIRQRSISRYTPKHREEVLAWLKERYPRRRPTNTQEARSDEANYYE